MGAIKVTPADKWFSLCVRQRAENRCERCGGSPASGGLHCSHFHGRGKWGVRFCPDNATSLCYGCHAFLGSHPEIHRQWQLERLGAYRFDSLQERANDSTRGRIAKREAKEIAKHYKGEYESLIQLRNAGAVGRLEFTGYL